MVDQLVAENNDLKKQSKNKNLILVINMEIDIEVLKESNEELLSRFELERQKLYIPNNKFSEKQFFINLKIIEDNHKKRSNEIEEKYETIFKSLNREYRGNISNLRKICFENKNSFLNNKVNLENEEILFLSQVEEQIVIFINKFQLLYEETKNKEKYIIDFDQKFENINEENKFLKRKISEEKLSLSSSMKQSDDFTHSNIDNKLSSAEINVNSKNSNGKLGSTLQKHIENSLENNEKIIKERDDLKDRILALSRSFYEIKETLTFNINQREELELLIANKEKEFKKLSINDDNIQKEIKSLKLEKEINLKVCDDLNLKLQEFVKKNINLELRLKISNETVSSLTNDIRTNEDENERKRNLMKEEFNEVKKRINENKINFDNEKIEFENKLKLKETGMVKFNEEKNIIENKFRDILTEKKALIDESKDYIKDLNIKLKVITSELENEKSKIITLKKSL